ncbi:MAG TPA: DUF6470 family protein [Feifaniaceae bacterium]|nr:DUF6470 family protein [Feifaniaceae bacterium]
MNSLSIHTQRAVIEITSRPAKMYIEHKRPHFKIKRIDPQMKIERKMPTFDIKWEDVRRDSGLPSPFQASRDFAAKGKQKVLDAIRSIVERGDILKDTTDPQAFEKVAVSVSVKDMPELNVGLMPKQKARIEWDPGYCTIEWTDPVLQIEWDKDFRPTIEWEPYAVEVRLRHRPLVKIRVNLEKIPGAIGVKVDQEI